MKDLRDKFRAGLEAVYVGEKDFCYEKGGTYVVGVDPYGDIGFLSDDNFVEVKGNIDSERFNERDWLIISDKGEGMKDLREKYKIGTEAIYVGHINGLYKQGKIYKVGYDSYGDYGFLDEDNYVNLQGAMRSDQFNESDWQIIEGGDRLMGKFKEGTEAIYVGKEKSFYTVGAKYKVGYDHTGDFGFIDECGDVNWQGVIGSSKFSESDWEILDDEMNSTVRLVIDRVSELIKRLDKLTEETFVITSEADIARIKDGAIVALANGESGVVETLSNKRFIQFEEHLQFGSVGIFVLKGATVRQSLV